MKKLSLLLLFLTLFSLTGCATPQLENRVLVVNMGLDLGKDDQIQLSIQISTSSSGKAGSGGGDSGGEKDPNQQDGYSIITVTGKDWYDALTMMRAASTHILNFTQIRAIVVSEKLSQDARFFDLLNDIYQMPQMRSNTYVLIAMGDSLAFLQNNKPLIGVSLSKYLDIVITNTVKKGYAPSSTIGELMRLRSSRSRSGAAAVVMLGAVAKEGESGPPPRRNPHDLLPNELAAEGSGSIHLLGAAVTDGTKAVGYLTGYEIQLLTLLRGNLEEILCYTQYGSVILMGNGPSRLSVRRGSPDVLEAKVTLSSFAHADMVNDTKEIEEKIKGDLTLLIQKLQALGCDAVGFGQDVVKGFDTIDRWEQYDWQSRFTQAQVEVTVVVTPMISNI